MDEICPSIGMQVIEKNIEPFDVYTADEAFMTGTPFCMLPVTSLNGLAIGDGKVGANFKRILHEWDNKVGINIENQIKSWAGNDDISGATPYQFKNK
jgi:branched-chain amino acid aminotransferase